MIRTNISISEKQHQTLKEESFKTGESLSKILRGLIDKKYGSDLGTKGTPKSTAPEPERKSPGLCKVCGAILNQYGLCNNLSKHK